MVGKGRHFEKRGFLKKIKEIKGYIVCDIDSFPNIPFWMIPAQQVLKWWITKELSKATHASRMKALKLIGEIFDSGQTKLR